MDHATSLSDPGKPESKEGQEVWVFEVTYAYEFCFLLALPQEQEENIVDTWNIDILLGRDIAHYN